MSNKIVISKIFILVLIAVVVCGYVVKYVFAQTAQIKQNPLYVPLIGITSVPVPLALPNGSGGVIYYYAVKNFLEELPLADVRVVDDKCSPVAFVEGDDDGNFQLDYKETWRFLCTTRLSTTTQSIATATGVTNNITATHKAYATVVVGSDAPAPLVSIVNITKVAYPLSLPTGGGPITFTYRVNNPGVVPLSDIRVTDDKCSAMSGKLGDTNGNNLLDVQEVWVYTCATTLVETTTNTVTVTAFANGLKAVGYATITITVDTAHVDSAPSFPETGARSDLKIAVWGILLGVLMALSAFLFATRKNKRHKKR